MVTLPQLLHHARARRASEIVLQSGQRPRLQTTTGPAELEHVLSESDLFDALTQVLGPEQQAELAVGNVVEFSLDGDHGGWSLVTEPGRDGVVVRGRANNGTTFDAPAAFDAGDDVLELPPLEPFHPDRESVATPRQGPRSTRFDVGVDYGPAELDAIDLPRPRTIAPQADVIAPPPTASSLQPIGDDELEFAIVTGPREESITADLGELVRALERGTLCLWRDDGSTDDLAAYVQGPVEIVDEGTLASILGRTLAELPADASYVVRLEDPSRCLGFVLRRLEEGARVLVETRARTGDGALRSLLGVGSTVNATKWLAAHRRRFLSRGPRGWRLDSI